MTVVAATCPSLPPVSTNSTWPANCTGATNGTRCVATCVPGFNGAPTTTCLNGNWSAVTGACNRTVCQGLPLALSNSSWPANCSGAVNGSVCTAGCTAGFTGTASSTCVNGNWSRPTGSCSRTGCPAGTGGLSCSRCPSGTLQPGSNTTCSPCPEGAVSASGSSQCFDTRVAVGYGHSCAVVTPEVVCEGGNDSGQASPPTNLANVISLCAGLEHTCAVTADGSVVCWGVHYTSPATPPANLAGAVLVRCGTHYTCALTAARTVTCWGIKATWPTVAPMVAPAAASSNVGHLAAGSSHACVTVPPAGSVGTGGKMVCFGDEEYTKNLPQDVTADLTAIAYQQTCVVRGGVPSCFPDPVSGSTSLDITPAAAVDVVALEGSEQLLLAVRCSGQVVSWGANAGLGWSPPAGTSATAVSTYDRCTCVRTTSGAYQCYAANFMEAHFRETFVVLGSNSSLTKDAAAAACAQVGAQLATLAQLQRDFELGAEWCVWGHLQEGMGYPMQRAGVPGCSPLAGGARLYTADDTPGALGAAVCFGVKPDNTSAALPFNNNTWGLFCGKVAFNSPTVCTALPPRLSAQTSWPSTCVGAALGSTCTGGCALGWSGPPTATCGISGVWMNATTCVFAGCPPGTGGPGCNTTCPADWFQPGNQWSCVRCPLGTTSPPGFGNCTGIGDGNGCPPGMSGANCATPCPVNTFQTGANKICQPCPVGWVSTIGASVCFDAHIYAASYYTCYVVEEAKRVVCRGAPRRNNWGTTGLTTDLVAPQNLTNVTAVATDDATACAVSGGRVTCFGWNRVVPPNVASLTDVVLVVMGYEGCCVLTASRELTCWQITTSGITPDKPFPFTRNVGMVKMGYTFTCLTVADSGRFGSGGRVVCVGDKQVLAAVSTNITADAVYSAEYYACWTINGRVAGCSGDGWFDAPDFAARAAPLSGVVDIARWDGADGNTYNALFLLANGTMMGVAIDETSPAFPLANLSAVSMSGTVQPVYARTTVGSVSYLGTQGYTAWGAPTPQSGPLETFSVAANISADSIQWGGPQSVCRAFGAMLANMDQVLSDQSFGAQWCEWGFAANASATGGVQLVFPVQQAGAARCNVTAGGIYTRDVDFTMDPVNPGSTITRADVTCWGLKPAASLPGQPLLRPFNHCRTGPGACLTPCKGAASKATTTGTRLPARGSLGWQVAGLLQCVPQQCVPQHSGVIATSRRFLTQACSGSDYNS